MAVGTGRDLAGSAERLARRVDAADRDDRPPRAEVDDRLRDRFRTLVCCLALTVLATSTRPGRILSDTKIDMAVNPVGFLGRALHLWDPEQFGQLQNQAAYYFFPMGPFYALGQLAGVPAWITQRMWLAALLCAAFLGARRLAARLGAGGPVTRLIGAMAYALGPHGLSALGQNSWEYLPLAMLPWIVLPLVTVMDVGSGAASGGGGAGRGARRGGGRGGGGARGGGGRGGRIRAAAQSGIAVALCGGSTVRRRSRCSPSRPCTWSHVRAARRDGGGWRRGGRARSAPRWPGGSSRCC